MTENAELISARVAEYLAQERASKNPVRKFNADRAMKANETHGFGGWFKQGWRIISLPIGSRKKIG